MRSKSRGGAAIFVWLRSKRSHVTEVGGQFVRLALQVVVQNEGDFVDVILPYPSTVFRGGLFLIWASLLFVWK